MSGGIFMYETLEFYDSNGYDLKDTTKLNTKLFTSIEKEKAEDNKTIGQKNREIVKTKLRNYYEV